MARVIRIAATWIVVLAITLTAWLFGRDYVRRHPQDVPWTELSLDDPIGIFTLRKLATLSDQPARCRALLRHAGSGDVMAPPRIAGPSCGYTTGIRLVPATNEARFLPAGPIASCPIAAALVLFERQVVQPAALRHLGSRVTAIDHAGTYSCRRRYGRTTGEYSEHATANALDITGFRTAEGRSVSVLRDWRLAGAEGEFLREVRDGGCRLFATVLSPDYNAAHADHLHFDQAERGQTGWGVCR